MKKPDICASLDDQRRGLEADKSCTYRGMIKTGMPECVEFGSSRNISDDSQPDLCRIQKKPVFDVWSSWEEKVAVNKTFFEWKKIETRQRDVIAHGDSGMIMKETKILEWYKTDQSRGSWSVGKAVCEQMGGQLFYHVNGTKEQLDFIFNIFGEGKHWLGIFTKDLEKWQTIDGGIIEPEMLFWGDGSPAQLLDHVFVGLKYHRVKKQRHYLTNLKHDTLYAPLCDMLI